MRTEASEVCFAKVIKKSFDTMRNPGWVMLALSVLVGLSCSGAIFPMLSQNTSFHNYAKEKVSALKNLRNALTKRISKVHNMSNSTNGLQNLSTNSEEISKANSSNPENPKNLQLWKVASIVNNQILSSKESRDGFLQQMLPKRDFLKKISEIREKLEPEVRKYFTDKYNSFLNNLVPYSETIGVPPYVLNSLKIPQNFDPRWQYIQSLLDSSTKNKLNGTDNTPSNPDTNEIQGRSDDQDLVSDQEPDATSKGQKKYQHIYISPRSRPRKAYLPPDRAGQSGYEISFDSVGQYGQDVYDTNTYTKGYYLDEYPYATKNDLIQAAGHHVARGHSRGDYGHGGGGGGYGHGHGGGGHGGLMDPFTILGGLAFLTYLGLLIQQSLNGTGGMGRSISDSQWEIGGYKRTIPVVLTRLNLHENLSQSSEIETPKTSHVKEEQKNSMFPLQNEFRMNATTNSSALIKKKTTECRLMCQIMKKIHGIPQNQQRSRTLRRIMVTSGQEQNGNG